MSSDRDKTDGSTSCAEAPVNGLAWLNERCEPDPGQDCSSDGRVICKEPYSIIRDGSDWNFATNGIVLCAIRCPAVFPGLSPSLIEKILTSTIVKGEQLAPLAKTTIEELWTWGAHCQCPVCGSHAIPIATLGDVNSVRGKIAGAKLSNTAIDKRRMMGVLMHLPNREVTVGSSERVVAICADGLTICIAAIDESKLDQKITDVFKLIER